MTPTNQIKPNQYKTWSRVKGKGRKEGLDSEKTEQKKDIHAITVFFVFRTNVAPTALECLRIPFAFSTSSYSPSSSNLSRSPLPPYTGTAFLHIILFPLSFENATQSSYAIVSPGPVFLVYHDAEDDPDKPLWVLPARRTIGSQVCMVCLIYRTGLGWTCCVRSVPRVFSAAVLVTRGKRRGGGERGRIFS